MKPVEENASPLLVQITGRKECDDGKTRELDCILCKTYEREPANCSRPGFILVWGRFCLKKPVFE